jgi:hypothetical protein
MPEIKVTGVVDDPSVSETFIDSPAVAGWAADSVIHAELYAIRRNLPTSGEESARAHVRARLALTIPAAVALQEAVSHQLAELEKQGVFKRTSVARPGEAKH